MNKTILKLLAVAATFGVTSQKVAAADVEKNTMAEAGGNTPKVSANMAAFVNVEGANHGESFGDASIQPRIEVTKGDMNINYKGSFYNSLDENGDYGDWSTSMNRIQLETDGWSLQLGRMQLKPGFASYLEVPFWTSALNDLFGAGSAVKFNGAHVGLENGWGFGVASQDEHLGAGHMDTALLTWQGEITPNCRAAAHIAADRHRITHAGGTVAVRLTPADTIVGEAFYKQDKTSVIVAGKHQLTDHLTAVAGAKFTNPDHGRMEGWVGAGLDYKVNPKFSVTLGGGQNYGDNHDTMLFFAAKTSLNYGIESQ